MITVVIPVGPQSVYKKYLPEALESLKYQTEPPDEILIIDDMADLNVNDLWKQVNTSIVDDILPALYYDSRGKFSIGNLSYWKCPWLSGVAHAFNYGVALSRNECVFMLGSDDRMYPTCLEECWKEYEKQDKRDGWYNVTIVTESGNLMSLPNNTCMVTKNLWKKTGGFPV